MSNAKRIPSFIPYFGHALALGRDPDGFIQRCQQRAGDCFEIKLSGRRVNFVLDPRDYPALIKHSKNLSSEDISLGLAEAVFGFDKNHMQQTLDVDHLNRMNQRLMQGEHLVPLTERMQDKIEAILLDKRHGDGFPAR